MNRSLTFLKLSLLRTTLICFSVLPCLCLRAQGTKTAGPLSSWQFKDDYQAAVDSRREGNYERALALIDRALSIAQENRREIDVLNCRRERAILFWSLGKIKESSAENTRIIRLAEGLKQSSVADTSKEMIQIADLYDKAKEFRFAANLQESVNEFRLAIQKSRDIGSKEYELKCLRQLSLTYWELEDLQGFFSLNSKGLALAEALNHRLEQSKFLNNIGLSYWKLDDYSAALKFLHKAYDLAQVIGNLETKAECLSNLGIVYFDLGDYDRAMENLIKALTIDEELKDEGSISKDLVNIGESHRRKGLLTGSQEELSQALSGFNGALELARKNNDSMTEIIILNNLGATYSHLGDGQKALGYFFSGLKRSSNAHKVEAMGMLLNNIGIVYSQLGNYEESTKYYQKAIDLALGISGGKILWEAYLEIADSYKKQDKWDAALENYKKSISVIENIRSGINTEELRATYLGTDKRIDAYYNIIDLFIRLYQKKHDETYETQAFDFLEKAKARSFLDSIEVSKLNLTAGIDQKLLNRETELMNDISRLHTKLLAPQLSPEQRDSITENLDNYENDLDSLKREIRETSPGYANLNYPSTATLAEAQKDLIDEGTVCFAYLLGKENSYAFAVSKDGLKIFSLPKKEHIQQLVQQHLRSITDPATQTFPAGHELFELLVKPGLLQNTKKIIIVPDDVLYLFPFETLMTEAAGREWLIKAYNIAYIPSLSSLRELLDRSRSDRSREPRKDILAIGDPDYGAGEIERPANAGLSSGQMTSLGYSSRFPRLKYSGQEVREIASLFKPQKRDVLLRNQATEKKFKSENLSDYRILHFATHALIDDKKPARSAIVLSLGQDSSEDGFIQMREVFNLRLHADLVVLSACETGLGRLLRGEGIEGLNRAFFYAGASSVLFSLWAINDQASYQLLERFYVHLRSSNSIMGALRMAKLEMINSGVLDHPYYWAGFIVTGEADKVIFPRDLRRWILATLSIAAGVAILLLFVSRDRTLSLMAKN
jgi:CHAT domain-containing protein/Tfp pilus assembly protein PilF